ncbi:MAG: transcription-repair coupling factor, partial [Lachnospiraceae bacterium]|nr:transcription-repair coupling factor [Lachnospiraceae bacterium]
MRALTGPFRESREYQEIQENIEKGRTPVYADGCIDPQKSHMVYDLSGAFPYKVIIAENDMRAKEIYEDYRFFDRETIIYPAKDLIFFSADVHGNLLIRQRLAAVRKILEGQSVTIITTIDAFIDRLMPLDAIKENVINVYIGAILDPEVLAKRLTGMGFVRTVQVEEPGQFAIRGGIIDIFNMTDEVPYRVELWDDEVDSIRSFDAESQRSVENVQAFRIYPAAEHVLTKARTEAGLKRIKAEAAKQEKKLAAMDPEKAKRLRRITEEFAECAIEGSANLNIDSYINYFFDETVSFADYFEKGETIFWLDEPARLSEHLKAVREEFSEGMKSRLENGYILKGQADILFRHEDILHRLEKMTCVMMGSVYAKTGLMQTAARCHVTTRTISSYGGSFELLVKELKNRKKEGYKVLIIAGSALRAKKLAGDL